MKALDEKQECQLAVRLRNHESGAMRDFYTYYSRTLSAVGARYVADDEDLKDVLQDALVKIFTHAEEFEYRGAGSLWAWASRIVVNEALSFLRKNASTPITYDEQLPDVADEDIEVAPIPAEVLHSMIRRMPEGYRAVFNLYVFEEKSHKEIAQLLGIKENSSASQFLRAKSWLKREIELYNKERSQR